MKQNLTLLTLLLVIAVALTGCSMSSIAKDFNGLPTTNGNAVGHVSTTNIALHFLFGSKPALGDASLEKTVSDFTAKAKAEGASKVRIVQSNKTSLWFIMPPITFFITPVITNVAGDAVS